MSASTPRRAEPARPSVQRVARPREPGRAEPSGRAGPRAEPRPTPGPRRNRRRGQPEAPGPAPVERLGSRLARARRSFSPPWRALRVAGRLSLSLGVGWGLLMAARGVQAYATTSPRFEVRSLIVHETRHVGRDDVRRLLALEPGTNILALDLQALAERLTADPWVASAQVTRHLPDTLEIELVERQPAALLAAGWLYLVDVEGQPFKRAETGEREDLPVITGIDRALLERDPEQAVAQVREALEILRVYHRRPRPRLAELHLRDDAGVTLYLAAHGTALHLLRDRLADRLERWDALRAALGERADRLSVVHLDQSMIPSRPERIHARFLPEPAPLEPTLGDVGEPEPDLPAAQAPAKRPPKPRERARRIPRAE